MYAVTSSQIDMEIGDQQFAGRNAKCYITKYFSNLARRTAKLCVDTEMRVPLHIGNSYTGEALVATSLSVGTAALEANIANGNQLPVQIADLRVPEVSEAEELTP